MGSLPPPPAAESLPAAVLGEDGRGYELAKRLDGCGVWKEWLGEDTYHFFAPVLASPVAWEAFLSPTLPLSQLPLQLRVRTLLFDKASSAAVAAALSGTSAAAPSPANLDPSYLQLRGDDVYFSLEEEQKQSRNRHDEAAADMWYSIFAEKFKMRKQNKLLNGGDKELHRRTSEGMSSYLTLNEMYKRKRMAFVEDSNIISRSSNWENGSYMHQSIATETNNLSLFESSFFPEIMFTSNCVPDTAVPINSRQKAVCEAEICGPLDNLPDVISASPAMMERFGLASEYVKIGSKYKRKASERIKSPLSEEQATRLIQKVIARLLTNIGFDGGSGVSMEAFTDFIGRRIHKLGQILKLLTDSYQKQFSSIEFLKMFLQIIGYRNAGVLLEITKDTNRGVPLQHQHHVRALQSQHPNSLLQGQFPRQMHPQMSMLHAQTMAFQQQQQQLQPQPQQQWNRPHMRKPATPRGSGSAAMMMIDKDQAMPDIKMENIMMDQPMDGAFGGFSKQQQHLQMRHQQMVMASQNTQASPQLKPLPSVQISQLQAHMMRTQPVKVEAFHELVGGDPASKFGYDHGKLASPKK